MTKVFSLVLALGVLATAAPAFADDAAWPIEIADRPFNLNGGMIEVHGSIPIITTQTGPNSTETTIFGGGGVAIGLSDQLELGADYAVLLSPDFEAKGIASGHIMVRLAHTEQLDAAIGVAVGWVPSANFTGFAGGLSARYRLNRQLSIYTDTGGLPLGCGSCIHVAGPVTGQLLGLAFDNGPTDFVLALPVGVGIQASSQLYLYGQTELADFEFATSGGSTTRTAVIGSDFIPLTVGGFYSLTNKFDVGVSFSDDLKNASDYYVVEFALRART